MEKRIRAEKALVKLTIVIGNSIGILFLLKECSRASANLTKKSIM
jgi:hypothetical protein